MGCALGILLPPDASIWLHQFLKAMRDEKGEVLKNAHLLGFFRRICRYARYPCRGNNHNPVDLLSFPVESASFVLNEYVCAWVYRSKQMSVNPAAYLSPEGVRPRGAAVAGTNESFA